MKEIGGYLSILKSYNEFCIGMFFAHVLWIQIAQVGACVQLWQTLIALLLVGKRWTRYQNAWKNVVNMLIEKIWRFYVVKCQNARLRAEMHKKKCSRANFENAYNGLKRVQKKIETNWSILKFWYARTCASRCARGICWHFYLNFDLKLMYTKYGSFLMTSLSRYDNDLTFTKWRLDDVTMT